MPFGEELVAGVTNIEVTTAITMSLDPSHLSRHITKITKSDLAYFFIMSECVTKRTPLLRSRRRPTLMTVKKPFLHCATLEA